MYRTVGFGMIVDEPMSSLGAIHNAVLSGPTALPSFDDSTPCYRFYWLQIPEILSGNMCADPGSASMAAAAEAWGRVAAEMSSEVLQPFLRVLDMLLDHWSGSSGKQMHEATGPFFGWLINLETELKATHQVTLQLCAAYADARKSIVPEELIADNRARRFDLIMTHELGLKAPGIADLDRQHEEWKVKDISVMMQYDCSVASALRELTPWTPPPPITIKAGSAQ